MEGMVKLLVSLSVNISIKWSKVSNWIDHYSAEVTTAKDIIPQPAGIDSSPSVSFFMILLRDFLASFPGREYVPS